MVNFNPFSKEVTNANQKFLAEQRGEQSVKKINKLDIPEKIKQELLNAEVFDFWFNEKDISSLIEKLIQTNDVLQYAATGIDSKSRTTLLTVTNGHLILLSKKLFSKPLIKVINIKEIKSVNLKISAFYGELTLVVADDILKINSINKTAAPNLAKNIKLFSKSANIKGDNSLDSQIEQIKKLKKLMDQGVLTEDEFKAKKKKLLGI